MEIRQPGLYHIYNRGNNRQPVFFNEANYRYFLNKCHLYLKPVSEIFAWCLMPNHFHFLIEVVNKSMCPIKCGGIMMPAIANGFRLLQSSFTKGINIQQGRTGNLFQQKTKAKLVSDVEDYSLTAFFYIHRNPVEAKLVSKIENWKYSSYREYTTPNTKGLCNIMRAKDVLGFSELGFLNGCSRSTDEENVKFIF